MTGDLASEQPAGPGKNPHPTSHLTHEAKRTKRLLGAHAAVCKRSDCWNSISDFKEADLLSCWAQNNPDVFIKKT